MVGIAAYLLSQIATPYIANRCSSASYRDLESDTVALYADYMS